eukprot:scaffold12517_cov101-Isochrysis_galbana.AAC.5
MAGRSGAAAARANILAAEREAQELGLLLQRQLANFQLDEALLHATQLEASSTGLEHSLVEMQATEELRISRVREGILRSELASCDVGGHIRDARSLERDLRAGRAGEAVRSWRNRVETKRHECELASRAAASGLMEDECEVTLERLCTMLAALHDQTAGALSTMSRELNQAREDAARLASIAVTAQTAALQLLQRCGRGRSERLDGLQAAGGLES